MATRKPLTVVAGTIQEIKAPDTIDPGVMTPEVYVQSTAPSVPLGVPYIWIHTGLGGGTDFAVLFSDGT